MKRLGTLAAVLVLSALAQPRPAARQAADAPRSPRNANYTLAATLDPAAHTITGSGRLTWRNIANAPAGELRFHMYWNAWRNTASTWMREIRLAGPSGLVDRPEADWGGIDLTRLALGGNDLLRAARYIAPDDNNSDDRTVLAVPLAAPVAPGETIEIDLAWTARVPRTFARTGRLGDYYFIAQWFPKIGVLEDGGWNCHQFHATTEFFADFGVYDVSLTVPAGWIVGATGRATSRADGAGTTTHRFQQADVHDFAWTASPRFVETTAKFEEPGLPPVDIRLLMQPEHTDQVERHLAATRAALKYYGTWFGAYPYGHLTVVDPVAVVNPDVQGEGTDGMEYPTLISAGTRYFPPPRSLDPEDVVVHETGHQFWYGVVASNEFEHAWMDEGLTTYSTARVLAEAFPNGFVATRTYFGGLVTWPVDDATWSRDVDGNRLTGFRRVASWEVPARPSWQYWPTSAGATTYNKTALWLATLERHLGWPTVQKILATYFARGAFRHPGPEEFFAIANEVSGQDLGWFFDAVYRSSATFDYGVAQVTRQPSGVRGITGDDDSRRYSAGDGIDAVDSVVVVRRYGDGVFPVDVRVTLADGSTMTEKWDGRARWQTYTYRRAAAVTAVDVDPDRVLMLDVNTTNNSWTSAPVARLAARRWSLRWLTWLEEVLLTHAFFV